MWAGHNNTAAEQCAISITIIIFISKASKKVLLNKVELKRVTLAEWYEERVTMYVRLPVEHVRVRIE